MEPIARPYGTDIFGSQGLALCNIPDGKKGTGAFIVLKLLLRREAEFRGTKGFFHDADIFYHFRKFLRLHGESSVRASVTPAESQMLFHHFDAKSDGTGGDGRPQGMIGKPHQTVKGAAQGGNHIQVDILIGSGIRGDTL